jgi:uncharacterized protein
MSIQKISRNSALGLALDPKAAAAATDAQASVRRSKSLAMPGRESAQFGIWEASPGRFTRDVVAGEIMHVLSGTAVFTSEDGDRIEMGEGDTLVFSPHTRGVWDIQTALRKLYVLL